MHFTLPRLSDWSRAKERVKRRRGERRESSEAKLPLRAPLLYREAQGERKKRGKISLPFHCLAPPPPPPASSFLLVSILLYPLGSLLTPPPSLLSCFQDRVVSEDLAELVEAILHLGNAGQLGLQPLLLLGEGEARCRVQLLKAPASFPVKLQQVGVVLPGGGEEGLETKKRFAPYYNSQLHQHLWTKIFPQCDKAYHREGLCVMESREMPASLAAWKIFPSTSMLTALVHSSNRAYLGLTEAEEMVLSWCYASTPCNRIGYAIHP